MGPDSGRRRLGAGHQGAPPVMAMMDGLENGRMACLIKTDAKILERIDYQIRRHCWTHLFGVDGLACLQLAFGSSSRKFHEISQAPHPKIISWLAISYLRLSYFSHLQLHDPKSKICSSHARWLQMCLGSDFFHSSPKKKRMVSECFGMVQDPGIHDPAISSQFEGLGSGS